MKDALSKTKPSAGKRKPSAARLQRVRDLRLVVCLLLTSAVGLCVLLLSRPMSEKLDRIKTKYGMMDQ